MSPSEVIGEAYERYFEIIARHCGFRLFCPEQGRDMAQDVFIRVFGYLNRGNSIDNIKAFLYRVANNMLADAARSKKKPALSLDAMCDEGKDVGVNTLSQIHDKLNMDTLLDALGRLPERHRRPILDRYIRQKSVREIAEEQGTTINMVHVNLYRATWALRHAVGPEARGPRHGAVVNI